MKVRSAKTGEETEAVAVHNPQKLGNVIFDLKETKHPGRMMDSRVWKTIKEK